MSDDTIKLTQQATIQEGRITGFAQDGTVLVDVSDPEKSLSCFYVRSTESPRRQLSTGDRVLVMSDARENRGYILGVIDPYFPHLEHMVDEIPAGGSRAERIELEISGRYEKVHVSGKTIAIEAEDEIRLTCGRGKISINKHGKIVIRGSDILSRSSGKNRIKGTSVGIN